MAHLGPRDQVLWDLPTWIPVLPLPLSPSTSLPPEGLHQLGREFLGDSLDQIGGIEVSSVVECLHLRDGTSEKQEKVLQTLYIH